MWLSRFCLILLAVVLYGCSQQQTGQQNVLNSHEEAKDGLLTLFDQMLNDRIKKIDGYTKAIGVNLNSPELFYKRALAVIEIEGMRRALGVCEEYKSSGKVDKKYTTDKTNVILKSINALNHEVTQTITQHKDCFKSGDGQQVIDAYRQRAVLVTYNQYDVRSDLKRAAELNSGFYQAYEMRADYLYFNDFIDDNITDAIEDYSKAISASPGNAQLYAKRGIALSLSDDSDKYSMHNDDCSKAIQMNPGFAGGYICRSYTLYDVSCQEYAGGKDEHVAVNECYKKVYSKKLEDINKAVALDPGLDKTVIQRRNQLQEKIDHVNKEIANAASHGDESVTGYGELANI